MDEVLRARGNPSGRVGGATRGPDDPADPAPRPPAAQAQPRPASR